MCVQRTKWSGVLSGFSVLLLLAAPLSAGDLTGNCRLGNQPAATLLVPYFEVDLANPKGRTTLVSVNNAAPRPTLARMVLWTDWGVPPLAFDIYLHACSAGVRVQLTPPPDGPECKPRRPAAASRPRLPGLFRQRRRHTAHEP